MQAAGIRRVVALCVLMVLCGWTVDVQAAGSVTKLRVPDGGLQPQVVVDKAGVLHVVYLKGNLFYAKREPGKTAFTKPIQVNSNPKSAPTSLAPFQCAHIALGKNNQVHVSWTGKTGKKGKTRQGTSVLYARMNPSGTAFEPQQDPAAGTYAVDGGGAIAADGAGGVYVVWHAGPQPKGRARQLFIARSQDGGKSFGKAETAYDASSNACGCCALNTFFDSKGKLHIAFRASHESGQLDTWLLTSSDKGRTFAKVFAHPWNRKACPMSTYDFSEGADGTFAAWETQGQVHYSKVGSGTVVAAPGSPLKDRKFPQIAVNAKGEVLMTWAEGAYWNRGGALAWQVFDRNGRPTGEKGREENGMVAGNLAAVFIGSKGEFVILH